MAGFFKQVLSLLVIGSLAATGSTSRAQSAAGVQRTGLIPLTAAEVLAVRAGRPRINEVFLNSLGFERVNRVRTEKGLAPLDADLIRPIGREIGSSIGAIPEARLAGLDPWATGDLPAFVDNSLLRFFPPIRDQAPLGSCASFATAYTQLSYTVAFLRNLDIREALDNSNKYSPKWAYNMVNGGTDDGSTLLDNYDLLERHGACTWAAFPYDANPRAWSLNASTWLDALSVRTNPVQYLDQVSSEAGLECVKRLLTDGYVLVFGTFIESWRAKSIQDDPFTADDDTEVGKPIVTEVSGQLGAHAMAIVGYNDAVWADLNGDGLVQAGEKGAFRVANSWGSAWHDRGFSWIAFDALRSVSAAPSNSPDRVQAFLNDMVFALTSRDDGGPRVVAEFTARHAKRDQLAIVIGRSSTETETPIDIWMPTALQNQGGSYAFDGSTTAVDGTFVFDVSDLLTEGAGPERYYLGVRDGVPGDPATLKAFRLRDLTTTPITEVPCSHVPLSADGGEQANAYVDYHYQGPVPNRAPQLSNPEVAPKIGSPADLYSYRIYYHDPDGDPPATGNIAVDGIVGAMSFDGGTSTSEGWYRYDASLAAGFHDFVFLFEDGRGGSARFPIIGAASGPEVFSHRIAELVPPNRTAGFPAFTLQVRGEGFVAGSVVSWDGSDRPTTFIDGSRIDAAISAEDISCTKVAAVTVRNPDGGHCNTIALDVIGLRPTVNSIYPIELTGGAPGISLRVIAYPVAGNSVVLWNGDRRATTIEGVSNLLASITAEDLAGAGENKVTVMTPPPGGGESNEAILTVSGFMMTSTPASATVVAGQTASYTINLKSQCGWFYSTATLTVENLPRLCTATFSPSSVYVGWSNDAILTVTTTAHSYASATGSLGPGDNGSIALAFFWLLPGLLFRVLRRKPCLRSAVPRWVAAWSLVGLLIWIGSCSAGGPGPSTDNGTPRGTYPLTVRGTSGNMEVTAIVTLIVN
ncbi:MAG: C1 family peptidase [Candidatus Aminicenantes bacterium]|nr:C1 family peptidase [Candidatus Aminicenantes bacterium]